ncbi:MULTISPECIES: NUDIX hydrolase [Actinoplanes]|uniref:7,8-dihydro-8-oxoguanine-triphosphatase n=2 Tax=Actinoplanes TaxID=1865 RepID=A0A101J9W5_9ACTN|nr:MULTISPECIES: 8-oxo-dGTP diphosphatase [Actinoplanes]KUL22898.1 7,8-dihydro-8-oxoguanine-triphosphatase [Actinoplanes awajinensis subsp. mycoplanecinus]GIE73430.1 7,8-dihydro-8-oxoguanine triphosphatase [Actinoplanes palleronii]
MRAVLATLGYVMSPDSARVLMIRRDTRPDDIHFGYYNGLGGKLEPDEDVSSGMRREIAEESGLECGPLDFAGTISWPGFGRGGENWFGFIFRIPTWTGTPKTGNDEGSLHWVERADLLGGTLPMWESDRHFLPLVFADSPTVFHGVMPFRDGKAQSWSYTS